MTHWKLFYALAALLLVVATLNAQCSDVEEAAKKLEQTQTARAQANPSATPTRTAPPVQPTRTMPPTATPFPTLPPGPVVLLPESGLLVPADVGPDYEQPEGVEVTRKATPDDVIFTYSTTFRQTDGPKDGPKIYQTILGKSKPYDDKYRIALLEVPTGRTAVPDAPQIGAGSVVYQGQTTAGVPVIGVAFFNSGWNVFISLSLIGTGADVTAANAGRLAQTAAKRLPDPYLPPAPLTFPEKLDPAAGAQAFQSIEVCKMKDGEFTPATTFSVKDAIYVWAKPAAGRIPQYRYSIAHYSPQTKVYSSMIIGIKTADPVLLA